MTHIAIRLCNSQGEPVAGSSVQEGGLDLRLTLHKIGDTAEPLSDEHNPRSQEGLFRGRASGAFEPTVLLMESRHEFRFQVMLLSSDIGGARMFVKVAPVRPDLAFNETLIVRSRSFVSRARMPDENFAKRQRLCPSPSYARLPGGKRRPSAPLLALALQPGRAAVKCWRRVAALGVPSPLFPRRRTPSPTPRK
jgi:hypothetical protein